MKDDRPAGQMPPGARAHGAEGSPLGRHSPGSAHYAPELLFAVERQPRRAELGVRADALPFVGEDLWNAYELSWLNLRGKPEIALGRFRVPATTPRLIESKSLKLYLNSLNQQRFGNADTVAARIAADLSAAAGGEVNVELRPLSLRPQRVLGYPEGVCVDDIDLDIDCYQPQPRFLRAGGETRSELLYSHLLKSNCLVTGQPDWGMLGVRYSGPAIDREGLLRYIVSYRTHDEFHEQCVERIFCDILSRCRPRSLLVWARYTRRGGLDINPCRASDADLLELHAHLIEAAEVRQ